MNNLIDNRYKIIKKIGEGGMGAVYLGEDTCLDRKVAIKRLQLMVSTAEFVEQMDRLLSMNRLNFSDIEKWGSSIEIYYQLDQA